MLKNFFAKNTKNLKLVIEKNFYHRLKFTFFIAYLYKKQKKF